VWPLRPAFVAAREPRSRIWQDNSRPERAEADRVVAETFADHPMVNIGGRAAGGVVRREGPADGRTAFVIAEVVLRPELAPIPPGGEFPDVTDEVLSEAFLVHATHWPYEPGSEEEQHAARELLERLVSALPQRLWRLDD
jgi:hypothetical protein